MRVLLLVPGLLAGFILLVTTHEAEVDVVGDRTQKHKGVEGVRGVEDDEGDMHQSVTQVAMTPLETVVHFTVGIKLMRRLTSDDERYSRHRDGTDQSVPGGAVPAGSRP